MGTRRILILKPDNIGDCVLFSGCLGRLRRTWPGTGIDLMVKPPVANLFELCPHVDRVLTTDRLQPWRLLSRVPKHGMWALARIVRRLFPDVVLMRSYDVLVCPVAALEPEHLGFLIRIRAKERWGFGGVQINLANRLPHRPRSEELFTLCYQISEEGKWEHELALLRSFLATCGIVADEIWPEFWASPEDVARGEKLVQGDSPLGIFVGAHHEWRRWPTSKWIELLRLQSITDHVVILGGGDVIRVGREIERALEGSRIKITNLCGRLSLRELTSVFSRCRAVVSNDSAGLHIATALRLPTVAILGGYHWGRFYPWGDPRFNRVASRRMDCFRCNACCVHGDFRCVRDIEVNVVANELEAAWLNRPQGGIQDRFAEGNPLHVV